MNRIDNNVEIRTDVYALDGTEQMKEIDFLAKGNRGLSLFGSNFGVGKVKLRTFWSDDGKVLVTQTEFTSKEASGTIITSMYLQTNDILVISYKLKSNSGASAAPSNTKRTFNRRKDLFP